jgi:hypothetical protein
MAGRHSVEGDEEELYENTQGVEKMVMNINMDTRIPRNHTGLTSPRLGSSMQTGGVLQGIRS